MGAIGSHCCGVRSNKINNDISVTAAANCITFDWPVKILVIIKTITL